ncbi:MAG: transporter substrate-binding domain-containing protein [Alphaproteobacteria bacterium]|nr:transporter substrate-binding domain-containing protein [Alphaproteobacteria bacterium]
MTRFISVLILSVLFFAASSNIWAAYAEGRVVRICYEPWAPFASSDESGNLIGPAREIVDANFKKLGWEPTYIELPYKRCVRAVASGTVHAILMDDENNEALLPSYLQTGSWDLSFLVLKGTYKNSEELLAMPDARIALSFEYEYPENVLSMLGQRAMPMKIDTDNIFNLLTGNRVHAILEDHLWLQGLIDGSGFDGAVVMLPPLVSLKQYLSFSPMHKDLLEVINSSVPDLGS